MSRARRIVSVVSTGWLVALLAPSAAPAQVSAAKTKACSWMALPAVEAALGAKSTRVVGSDGPNFHSCSVTAGPSASAKLEQHVPGQPGLPRDVPAGLAGARQLVGSGAKDFEGKAFGAIGCYRHSLSMGSLGDARSTSCFMPGGYLVLTLTRQDAFVPMETVRDLLQQVAAQVR